MAKRKVNTENHVSGTVEGNVLQSGRVDAAYMAPVNAGIQNFSTTHLHGRRRSLSELGPVPLPWRLMILGVLIVELFALIVVPKSESVAGRATASPRVVAALPPEAHEVFNIKVLTDTTDVNFGIKTGGASSYLFPPGALAGLPAPYPPNGCYDWQQWALDNGGVPTGTSYVSFTVSAISDETVRVHGVKVHVERLVGELVGDVAACQQGSPPEMSYLRIDLDKAQATYRYSEDAADPDPPIRPFALEVTAARSDQVMVMADSGPCYCRWHLDLDVEVGGHYYPYRVDNGGEPFVAAPLHAPGYSYFAYSSTWISLN
ncbi:hypothetical protein AB0H12_08720 [Actinosynnema sp. NPDC023794]